MSKTKKIIHLSSYFSGISAVYDNIFKEIDNLNYRQQVYVPNRLIKRPKEVEFKISDSNIYFRKIWNFFSRIAYFYKINKAYQDIETVIEIKDQGVIHAHSWFTDGGLAYKLYKKHHIPYVITVRSTDVNIFVKKLIHLRSFGKKILEHAEKIIFVSKAYEQKVLNLSFLKPVKKELQKKSVVIPNGIDVFWLKNVESLKESSSDEIKLIYVGNFLRRKNLDSLIQAIDMIDKKGIKVNLEIVGGGREYSQKLVERVNNHPHIRFLGKIKDKRKLADIIRRNDIFAMPSYNETFGLVYIEALSQGVPVIYSKNEGIDGFHSTKIGEAVDHKDIDDIANGIIKVHCNYNHYNFDPRDIVAKHNWKEIAKELTNIYDQIYKN